MTPEREASELVRAHGNHLDAYWTAYNRLEATETLAEAKHYARVCNVILMASERLSAPSKR